MAVKEKSVRATMLDLEVNGSAVFPLERYDYVVSCRTRLQTTTQMRFSSKIDKAHEIVTITRDQDIDAKPKRRKR